MWMSRSKPRSVALKHNALASSLYPVKSPVGNKSNLVSYTTTLTDNLNQSPAFYGYTVNSPAPESSFPTWDYVNGYTVVVSRNAFGAAGFGGVTIGLVHNSPAKKGNNAVTPTNCTQCVTNIAYAGTNRNGMLVAMASAQEAVCTGNPPGCTLGPCTPPYPFPSTNALTSIAFNESEVLRTSKVSVVTGCIPNQIQVFYNDEHALTLGIREVNVLRKSGKITTTSYPVTPLGSNPGTALNPLVGSTQTTGDQGTRSLLWLHSEKARKDLFEHFLHRATCRKSGAMPPPLQGNEIPPHPFLTAP